jgi:hypothetical protein
MALTTREMEHLASDAREMSVRGAVNYIADAKRCLCDTRDPLAAVELLRALWGSSHGKRGQPKEALEAVGKWLAARVQREIGISTDRLALELGWLHRLVTIYGAPDDEDDEDANHDRGRPRRTETAAPFGAHIELLRARRAAALTPRDEPAVARDRQGPAPRPRPDRLPEIFEARFASSEDTLEALRVARKRRKQNKPAKDRLLAVVPVAPELQPLATDLACSMTQTEGMNQLLDRVCDLPMFSIATADLVIRDGKRVPSRIALAPQL